MNLSSFSVKRPVGLCMCVLSLIVFGISSVFSMKMESTPEMNMPVLMVRTSYSDASPEEVDQLVTDVIESALSQISDVDSMTSRSSEGSSMTMLEFDYSVDTSEKREDIEEALQRVRLPDSADDPVVMEMSMDSSTIMELSIQGEGSDKLMSYIDETIVPELEKINGVASVETMGGSRKYVQILLNEENMKQYKLSMSDIANAVMSADFTSTIGDINRGEVSLSLTASESYSTPKSLEDISISLSSGDIIHLSDIAAVSLVEEEQNSISRYNGMDNINISISKNQSANTIEVCNEIAEKVEKLNVSGLGIAITVSNNSGEQIYENIMNVVSSLLQGLAISMFVLLLFLGDWRAAMIVAVSMPLSVFAALVLMSVFGMTINLMSLGGLVVGIGMMVDNSIVVLESCFTNRTEIRTYADSAIEGAKLVSASVVASTVTTIVVFLPIALMDGMAGQLFKQVGFTIVFSMLASLISALTMVPMLFVQLAPVEKKNSKVNRALRRLENGYGKLLKAALTHKIIVIFIALCVLGCTVYLYTTLEQELMPNMDQGQINISVETKTGLSIDKTNEIMTQIEQVVSSHEEVESYSLSSRGGGSASMSVYLNDSYQGTTQDFVSMLRKETIDIENCSISVSERGGMSFGGNNEVEIRLTGENYDILKESAEQIRSLVASTEGIDSATSSLSSGSPEAVLKVDHVQAAALGLTPSAVVSQVRNILSGMNADSLQTADAEYDIKIEYPPERFHDISDLSGLMLTVGQNEVPLTDVAQVVYSNQPSQIQRIDGDYVVTVTGQTASGVSASQLSQQLIAQAQGMNLDGITVSQGSNMRRMESEFGAIGNALATSIFLVFVVMAFQFESCRFSLVVMLSVPFSMTGAFLALSVTGMSISMTSLIGLIMLVGIVVNNAIVLIDYTSYLRKTQGMSPMDALIASGKSRLRPILMTTLTTILSLIPMAAGIGGKVEMMQSMAVVVIGGLSISTLLTLILVPTVYLIFDKQDRNRRKMEKGKNPRPPKHNRRDQALSLEQVPHEFQDNL